MLSSTIPTISGFSVGLSRRWVSFVALWQLLIAGCIRSNTCRCILVPQNRPRTSYGKATSYVLLFSVYVGESAPSLSVMCAFSQRSLWLRQPNALSLHSQFPRCSLLHLSLLFSSLLISFSTLSTSSLSSLLLFGSPSLPSFHCSVHKHHADTSL